MVWQRSLSALAYIACYVYFRFFLSKRGNRYSSAEATRLRSPQMIAAYLLASFIGWRFPAVSVSVAYSAMAFYYALRFGSLRLPTFIFFLSMSFFASPVEGLWGSASGLVVAFCVDMYLNHWFKKKGIIVPGVGAP